MKIYLKSNLYNTKYHFQAFLTEHVEYVNIIYDFLRSVIIGKMVGGNPAVFLKISLTQQEINGKKQPGF